MVRADVETQRCCRGKIGRFGCSACTAQQMNAFFPPVVKLEPFLGPGAAPRGSNAGNPGTPRANTCRGDLGALRPLTAAVLFTARDVESRRMIYIYIPGIYTTGKDVLRKKKDEMTSHSSCEDQNEKKKKVRSVVEFLHGRYETRAKTVITCMAPTIYEQHERPAFFSKSRGSCCLRPGCRVPSIYSDSDTNHCITIRQSRSSRCRNRRFL